MQNLIRYLFLKIGDLVRAFKIFILRRSGIEIGDACFISSKAKFDMTRGKILIGNKCAITYGCCLISHDPMVDRLSPGSPGGGTIIIEDHVYLGINTIVLKDVKIGHHAIVGAGTIVTNNIPPYAVVVGNPGRIIKYWGEEKEQCLG